MENLEFKTKKMSLANIEGKLSVTEMEQIMAGSGSDCAWAVAGLVATFAGAFVTTTPIGAGIFLGSMIISGVGMKACN